MKVSRSTSKCKAICSCGACVTVSSLTLKRFRGRQQLSAFHGVRDASAMFAASPKPAVPTSTLKDASQAAQEAGGDAQDMAAMAAAMQYRKTTGAGKMQYAKGKKIAASVQPVANEKKYGLGMDKVAGMGEQALAKQLSEENDSHIASMLPEHVEAPKPTETRAQIAENEISDNDREADNMLPEHNLEAPHKSLLNIRGGEMKYNSAHAKAVMPKSEARNGAIRLSRAHQAQSEEAEYSKRAEAIVPEHTEDHKTRTQADIIKSEEKYNAKHADAILPEHNREMASKTRSQIRQQEEDYNADHASKVLTEHTQEGQLHRTQAQIRSAEEKSNELHANAVVPPSAGASSSAQRLSVAEQAAREENQMAEDASNVVVTDHTIDRAISEARANGAKKLRAFEQDRSMERHSVLRRKRALDSHTSYSYDKLYADALKKEERRDHHDSTEVRAQQQMQKHIQTQINEIEGKGLLKMTASEVRQQKIEQENDEHIASQVDAITASAGPRDASHMVSDGALNRMAMKATSKHLNSEVNNIMSSTSKPVPKKTVVGKAAGKPAGKKQAVPKKESTAAKTAKMLAAEHKMTAARDKKLFNVYSKTATSTARPEARHPSWAAQVTGHA